LITITTTKKKKGVVRLASVKRGDTDATKLYPYAQGIVRAPTSAQQNFRKRSSPHTSFKTEGEKGEGKKEEEEKKEDDKKEDEAEKKEQTDTPRETEGSESFVNETSEAIVDLESSSSSIDGGGAEGEVSPISSNNPSVSGGGAGNYSDVTEAMMDYYADALGGDGEVESDNAYSTVATKFEDEAESESESPPTSARSGHPAPGAKATSIPQSKSDLLFNEEWQRTVEDLRASEGPQTYQKLSDLSRKFAAVSSAYGKIIIRELHLPLERKLIKPMNLGGVIGGEKYCVAGILFKIARPGFFESDEPAAKVAGHEL
jgi:hypothetical protein